MVELSTEEMEAFLEGGDGVEGGSDGIGDGVEAIMAL